MRPLPRLTPLLLAITAGSSAAAGPVRFERVVIDADFPGGYQVEVADVNGDGKPDVVGVGGGTCAWYENPSWTKRVVSTSKETPAIISSATADLDGDGKAEVAIAYDFAMNEPRRGKLLLAVQGAKVDDPWSFRPVADVPSIHRLRWGWVVGTTRLGEKSVRSDKKPELVVAPIFGPSARPPAFDQEPAHLTLFDTGADPKSARWTSRTIGEAPVLHAIELTGDADRPSAVLGASNRGVTSTRMTAIGGDVLFQSSVLSTGAEGQAPKKGASEVHAGRLRDGRRFLATVEPWHGNEVVVSVSESPRSDKFGPRAVLDDTLDDGHALWVADVDGDGDDEVFAGHRGKDHRISMYDFDGKEWDRTVVDADVAAQDLRGGDLDGDGVPDVVAIGGKTHNVVWYRPVRPAK